MQRKEVSSSDHQTSILMTLLTTTSTPNPRLGLMVSYFLFADSDRRYGPARGRPCSTEAGSPATHVTPLWHPAARRDRTPPRRPRMTLANPVRLWQNRHKSEECMKRTATRKPSPGFTRISFTLPNDLLAELDAAAAADNRTRSNLLRRMVHIIIARVQVSQGLPARRPPTAYCPEPGHQDPDDAC